MLGNIRTESSSSSISRGLYDDQNVEEEEEEVEFRDIHALITPPASAPTPTPATAPSHRSSNLSVASDVTNSSENTSSMSREFNALVLAGSNFNQNPDNLNRIGEEEEETNPLAIVPDMNPVPSPGDGVRVGDYLNNITASNRSTTVNNNNNTSSQIVAGEIGVDRVKKEEVDSKISAWETAKIAKINNRFKREDAVITGWENEQIHKASTSMKIIERKLEEKRAKAREKMENEIAKARRKAEEKRASAEAKRGTKAAKVLQVSNLMRALGRPPAKRSFF